MLDHKYNFREVNMNKREDYINWDTYFMGIAKLSAQRMMKICHGIEKEIF